MTPGENHVKVVLSSILHNFVSLMVKNLTENSYIVGKSKM